MVRRRSLAVVGILVVAVLGGCADKAKDQPLGYADPAFYEVPDPVPGDGPGDIVRVEDIDGMGGDGKLLRVLYRSESLAGEPIAVSGVIAVPPGEPPPGGWPVLSLAHGTVGLADACAPSSQPGQPGHGGRRAGSSWWPRTTRASARPAATRTSSGRARRAV